MHPLPTSFVLSLPSTSLMHHLVLFILLLLSLCLSISFTFSPALYHHLYVSCWIISSFHLDTPVDQKLASFFANNLAQCKQSAMGCGNADNKEEGPKAPKHQMIHFSFRSIWTVSPWGILWIMVYKLHNLFWTAQIFNSRSKFSTLPSVLICHLR